MHIIHNYMILNSGYVKLLFIWKLYQYCNPHTHMLCNQCKYLNTTPKHSTTSDSAVCWVAKDVQSGSGTEQEDLWGLLSCGQGHLVQVLSSVHLWTLGACLPLEVGCWQAPTQARLLTLQPCHCLQCRQPILITRLIQCAIYVYINYVHYD